jgi:hypothetical protein
LSSQRYSKGVEMSIISDDMKRMQVFVDKIGEKCGSYIANQLHHTLEGGALICKSKVAPADKDIYHFYIIGELNKEEISIGNEKRVCVLFKKYFKPSIDENLIDLNNFITNSTLQKTTIKLTPPDEDVFLNTFPCSLQPFPSIPLKMTIGKKYNTHDELVYILAFDCLG